MRRACSDGLDFARLRASVLLSAALQSTTGKGGLASRRSCNSLHALKANLRTPWYGLLDEILDQPIINEALLTEYDSLLAEPASVPQISPLTIESHFAMNELERALTDEDGR